MENFGVFCCFWISAFFAIVTPLSQSTVSVQIGQDLETHESVGIGNVEVQANQAMANIAMLIEEAGGTIEHLVKLTIYLVDPRYREVVYRAIGRATKGVHPISTGVVISALARPEWLVEIDAIAVVPEASA